MITANEVIEKMKANDPGIDAIMSTIEKLIIKAAEENCTSVEAQNFVEDFDDKTKNLII